MTTRDHDAIRQWAESRGGRPSVVKETDGGILRIDFAEPDDSLAEISWDEFFKIFDDSNLAFLHQDTMSGGEPSRFNKFVSAEPAEDKPAESATKARSAMSAGKAGDTAKASAKKPAKSASTSTSASAAMATAPKRAKKGQIANGAAKD